MVYEELSGNILKAYFCVLKNLGTGYLESVYENGQIESSVKGREKLSVNVGYASSNPKDYKDTTIPVNDAGEKGIYEEIPLVFKVKSGLSVKRCKQLIADVMEKDNLTQGEIGKVNWVKEIQASLREAKKAAKEAEVDE